MTDYVYYVSAVWIGTLLMLCVAGTALSQDGHRHPPADARAHHEFYYWLTRPDIPNSQPGSCCGSGDCYSTQARQGPLGQWQALRREDRVWIDIPEERIVTRQDQLSLRPTYEATLCALPHMTYCCVPPEGGV
jgi:hypothetical protein